MKFSVIILLIGLSLSSTAQSYHFSQFYSTPLLNNPAFTGYTDGASRVAGNFRSQWSGGGSPFLTSSLSADFSLLRDRLPEGNKLGAGITLMNDQSLEDALQTNSLGFSAAYNLTLDADKLHHLGAGLQGVFHQRTIDFTKLTFENQFSSNGYDASASAGEAFNNRPKKYMDMNAGLLYNYTEETKSFFGSVGVFNVLQHKENIQPDEFKVPLRYSIITGGQFEAGYSGNVYLSLNHIGQAGASSTTLGGAYGILLGEDQIQEFKIGLWHRLKDAIIPYVGYQLNTLQFGLSYDYSVSSIKAANQIRNGFELTFVYRANDKTELKRLIPWY